MLTANMLPSEEGRVKFLVSWAEKLTVDTYAIGNTRGRWRDLLRRYTPDYLGLTNDELYQKMIALSEKQRFGVPHTGTVWAAAHPHLDYSALETEQLVFIVKNAKLHMLTELALSELGKRGVNNVLDED